MPVICIPNSSSAIPLIGQTITFSLVIVSLMRPSPRLISLRGLRIEENACNVDANL